MSNKTHFVHVLMLDESGSMSSMKDSAISGFNENIQQIRADAEDNPDTQDHRVCLVTFNGRIDTPIWLQGVSNVVEIDDRSYTPSGSTSLRDAISQTISDLRKDLADEIDDDDTDINILVTILSDGMDTSSRDTSPEQVKTIFAGLELASDDSPWTVNYVGADADCITEVRSFGLGAANTSAFDASAAGARSAMGNMRAARASYTKAIANHGLSKSNAEALYQASNVSGEAMTDAEIEQWKVDNGIGTGEVDNS